MKIYEIAKSLGLSIIGESDREILGPATLSSAKPENISFYHNKKYRSELLKTAAGAVIIRKRDLPENAKFTAVISDNPLDDFRKVVEIFHPFSRWQPEISELAHIESEAKIGSNVRIEPFAVVGNCVIGDGCRIGASSIIGENVEIGENTEIFPRVVIYPNTVIGKNVVIHSGAVIGSDGFGYSRSDDGVFKKIPQIGRVIIEDDVEIGANTTIDRGALDDTIIGAGTKIDNLVQIGHNVVIGKNCAITGQVGISGSCKIGDRVLLGGQSGLAGHLTLGNDVVVFAQSGVDKSFGDGVVLFGSPARPSREAFRQLAAIAKLPEIIKKIK